MQNSREPGSRLVLLSFVRYDAKPGRLTLKRIQRDQTTDLAL